MLEVLKNIAPMFLAVIFVYTAAVFVSAGIKKKSDRKIAIIGACAIMLVSFTIWIPCFNDLYEVIGLLGETKQFAMIASIALVLLFAVIATIFNLKREET